ncbi:MAG: GlcG/HbpS family heme-binding protein, partial [Rubrobacteraceae bacterium]
MITLEDARRVVSAAEEKAWEIGQPMNIAVYDVGRNLKDFSRMDGAWLGSIEISIDKTYTSTSFEMTTQDLSTQAQPGQPLFGIHTTSNSRVVIFAGGVPIERDGQ